MEPAVQPQLIHLPHSDYHVPHTGYAITGYKGHTTHDGVAFTATLRHDKKIIGTVENSGRGGSTFFYPNEKGLADREDAKLEAFWQHTLDDRGKTPMELGAIFDALITEYEFTRDAAKAAKRGNILLRQMTDYESDEGPMGWPSIYSTTEAPASWATADPAKVAAQIAKHVGIDALGWWQRWDADTATWIDVTDRPAHLRTLDQL